MARSKPSSDIYQLKVTLRGIRPPIWRRVLVTGDATLAKLHRTLQAVMGWEDYHLHQFRTPGTDQIRVEIYAKPGCRRKRTFLSTHVVEEKVCFC